MPSKAEYEAIRQALMETARGRWFLDEFARTNRNADTATVLAAVARLEQALIDKPATIPPQSLADSSPDHDAASNAVLHEALKRVEDMIAAREQLTRPIARNLQKLQDMIWALREGGADGRVCNLLATQTQTVSDCVAAVESSMTTISSAITDLSHQFALEMPAASAPEMTQNSVEPMEKPPEADVCEVIGDASIASPEITENARLTVPEQSAMQDAPQIGVPDRTRDTAPSLFRAPSPAETLAGTLGDAILASGLMPRKSTSQTDPLAAFRRMSQSEKIALFT